MNKLLIVSKDAEEYANHLRYRNLPALQMSMAQNTEQAQELITDANIVLGTPALVAPLLHKADKLQWVQSSFAGIEPFCSAGLRTDYRLTGVKDIFGSLMSEYVFAYLLAFERNVLATRDNQLNKQWQTMPYRRLEFLSIGICGLGSIGQQIAKTAMHFNMKVLGLSRSATQLPMVEKVFSPSEICHLAKQVDYLVTVLPNTPETHGIINRDVLDALGPTGVFINVGRGAAVDEYALINALKTKAIRGAVLDVFQTEPLPQESPLWELENVFITPHNSAITFAEDIVELFCENYRLFQAGEALNYIVDFDRQY
ncbi:D-2-hydroxyacid dehydrogenase [bacterium SCSIO 12696]|nr:D-2-hydroxyacid dehydrogenase [bacterium SCSIO 12696]